jgi:fatty-acyl-CoA synthase
VTLGLLFERAAASGSGVRFLDGAEREEFHPYSALYLQAAGVAGGLRARGIAPGDRVGIILPTAPAFYHAFFGVLLAGAVPTPLYPPLRLGRMEEYHERTAGMLRAAEARLVVTNEVIRRVLGRTMERAAAPLGCITLEDLPRSSGPRLSASSDDTALIQFSSGTTADPKPVRLSHRQILANVEAIAGAILSAFPEGPGLTHTGVSWLPLYHDMGLIGCLVTAVAHPADLTLIPPEIFAARPAIWLRAISRYRATISAAPNFAYGYCVERVRDEDLAGVDLSCWRLALNGAEPVTPRVLAGFIERFGAYGFREEVLTPVYGLAEATLAVTFSDPRRRFESATFDRQRLTEDGVAQPAPEGCPLVSVGKPLPGCQVQILLDDGTLAPNGHLGRVLVRGPSLMQGYHAQPEATHSVMKDGWLETGDRGFLLDGSLFLYGREKDLIILRGRNHAPQDIEQALEGLPGIRPGCCAAIGVVPEGAAGEILVILAERARDASPTAAAELVDTIRAAVNERTGLRADRVVVLQPGSLPRTSSGKIRRSEAGRLYLAGALSPPAPVGRLRLALEMLRSAVAFSRRRK